MARRISPLVIVLFLVGANLSAEPLPARQSDFSLPTDGQLVGFASTAAGDKFLINRTFDLPPFGGGLLRRLNAAGQEVWRVDLGAPPLSIAVSPDETACVIFEKDFLFGLETQLVMRCVPPSGPTGSDPEVNLPGFTIFGLGSGIGAGVVIDQARNRVYAMVPSINFQFGFDALIVAYDRSLNFIAQRPHVFEDGGGPQQFTSISIDSSGNVWTSGVESFAFPLPRKVFIERHPPNLTTAPAILRRTLADYSISLKAVGDSRGGVIITGDRDDSGNFDTFQRISADESGNLTFGNIFRIQGYGFGPFAVDLTGSILAATYVPGTGTPSITKRGQNDLPSWSPEFLPLPVGRDSTFIQAPVIDTFDVAGTVSGGAPTTFISRYVPGSASTGKLHAVSPLSIEGGVDQNLSQDITVAVKDDSNVPIGDVAVNFTCQPPAGVSVCGFFDKDSQTNALGLAKTGFEVGNIPLEYLVQVACPSCVENFNSVSFQVCGKLNGKLYFQNFDDPDSEPYIGDFIAGSEADPIQSLGCALTSYTMLLNIFRDRYGLSYPAATPGTLNKALDWDIDFEPTARLNMHEATPHFTGGQVIYTGSPKVGRFKSVSAVMSEVADSLAQGNPAIIRMGSPSGREGHSVVAIGKCGNDFIVLDPFVNPNTGANFTRINPASPPFPITGARLFIKGPPPT